MPAAPVRLLCTGDLHLGRFPSYVPPNRAALSVETAWERAVDLALDEAVDAVVLTGDVADQDNKVFEAFGPLKAGIERLAGAGIPVVAVAGNHDWDALHRLADLLDPSDFTLLGPRGTWTDSVIRRDGAPALRLVGWSFPARHVPRSPLDTLPALPDDLPVVGVLHADLDQPDSPYAPVRSADLVAAPPVAWLLGHVHLPQHREEGGTCILYPGSLQPLDPGERGAHGPWIVTVGPAGAVSAVKRPLAPLRYDAVEVDVEGAPDWAAVEAAVVEAVGGYLAAAERVQPDAVYHVLDLHLRGRTAAHGALADRTRDLPDQQFPHGGATAVVRRVFLETAPDYDLADVARRRDPAGAVARLVLDVRDDAPAARAVLDDAVRTLEEIDRARAFAPLRRGVAPGRDRRDEARDLVVEQSLRLLDHLLQQAHE